MITCKFPDCKWQQKANPDLDLKSYCPEHEDWGMITFKPIGKWKLISDRLQLMVNEENHVSLNELLCKLLEL